jgi:hypothetical protein
MSKEIVHGVTGARYKVWEPPKYIGYWSMLDGMMKTPAEFKPSLWKRITHKLAFGWTWHDGMDGL